MTNPNLSRGGRFRALYAKEMRAYFNNPTAYIIAVVFLLLTGYFFAQPLFLINQAEIRSFMDSAPLLLVFFMPVVAMRLFSDETKTGTLEILLTLPVEDWEVLLSKFLAAFTLIAATLAMTLVYPVSVAFLGRVDPGGIAGAYIGLLLTGGLLAAAGLFASSLTRNQVVASIIGFLIGFVFYMLGKAGPYAPWWLSPITDFMGLDSHLDSLSRGVLDSRDLAYYLTVTGLFLFLAQVRLTLSRSD